MHRYFLEVAYKGTQYSGFQIQQNANSIQAEVEKALYIFLKEKIELTGSSRTDAGVHALQNYFHFDVEKILNQKIVYNLNAILPPAIVVKSIKEVKENSHCRFDATARLYQYFITQQKNPFLLETAWHFPFKIEVEKLHTCALLILQHQQFEAFCKTGTQVNKYNCHIQQSFWKFDEEKSCWIYTVKANRFLRGMVKALVSTMLLVARNKIGIAEFEELLKNTSNKKADFTAPSHGLFLCEVKMDESLFINTVL